VTPEGRAMARGSEQSDKSNKLKARLPRGLADSGPAEIAATRAMIEKIRAVYELYGFEPVETPAVEYSDALGKFLPDQDRPNEGVFSFQDDDEQWLSLRYDLTAPLARYVAENFDTLAKPYRSYRVGNVFRNEKPGPGRFRQFMQFDADTVGSAAMAADAELCMMAADTMEALGIARRCYVVKVNNRKVLDGRMQAIGLGGANQAQTRLIVMRAIDKYDRLGSAAVRLLLGKGRTDESGDFTKGAALSEEQIANIMGMFDSSPTDQTHPAHALAIEGASVADTKRSEQIRAGDIFDGLSQDLLNSTSGQAGLAELREIWQLVSASGYDDGRIRIDPSIVRGLEYYTGPVFEVELTFAAGSHDGAPRFGSVGGGGRYDGLVSRFRAGPVPATGFSIGVSRLLVALKSLGQVDSKAKHGPVVVTVFDNNRIADYQNMVAALRRAGISAELYLGAGKFGPQLKYADRRNSPCVVIQGSDEKAKGEVTIKDLILGTELAKSETGRQQHLQKQVEAQRAVPESQLVDAVRAVLARHRL
jgi:histidyl-tRNA synthetase